MKKMFLLGMLSVIVLVAVSCASSLRASEDFSDANEEWGVLYPFQEDGLWGYKDDLGNIIIEPQFRGAGDFSEGLAFVTIGYPEILQRGFIDLTGELVISLPLGRLDVGDFSEGFARVNKREWDFEREMPNIDSTFGPYVFIDRTGRNVFEQEFLYVRHFEGGFAIVTLFSGNDMVIDRTGQNAFGREFREVRPFDENGYALVIMLNGRQRYLHRSGRIVRNRPR